MDSIPYQLPLVPAEKFCSRCKGMKPISDFSPSTRAKSTAWCKPCHNAYARERRQTEAPERRWRRKLGAARRNRGIQPDEYMRLFNEQGGVCAICASPGSIYGLSVDHNHQTGAIRGLLCNRCNGGIGGLQDDPRLLEEAIRYLRRHDQP